MNRMLVSTTVLLAVLASIRGEPPTAKAYNLSKVNTSKDEDEPHFVSETAGQGTLYYSLGADLYTARRDANKGWLAGKPFNDVPQRGEIRSVFVFFHKSGAAFPQTLFYATNADAEKADGRGSQFDLYSMVRNASSGPDFTVPGPVLAVCTPTDEMHPWLTADGKLYFSRKTNEGWRVFVSQRSKPDKPFEKPSPVDLPVGFHHATLSPEGRTMYLQGPLDKGRWGLFRSVQSNGKWSEPEELADLNHSGGPTGDRSPNLSRNGATLYFASDRPGGKGGLDIWYVATSELGKKR